MNIAFSTLKTTQCFQKLRNLVLIKSSLTKLNGAERNEMEQNGICGIVCNGTEKK